MNFLSHLRVHSSCLHLRLCMRGVSDRAWNSCKVGRYILLEGAPYKVTKAAQGGRGRGGSWVKCTVKNLLTSKYHDKTFNSDEQLEIPDISFHDAQFSWHDAGAQGGGGEFVFMDCASFEEVRVGEVSKAEFLQVSI